MADGKSDYIIRLNGYTIVVTDGRGDRFVMTGGFSNPSVMMCSSLLADVIMPQVLVFKSEEIARDFRQVAVEAVIREYKDTRIATVPPYDAKVVPLSFTMG